MSLAEDRGFIARHRAVWRAVEEAGLISPKYHRLETGHLVTTSFSSAHGLWFANVVSPFASEAGVYCVWLCADDDGVPEALREALTRPGTLDFLRSTMP